jgi:hypothetical protein
MVMAQVQSPSPQIDHYSVLECFVRAGDYEQWLTTPSASRSTLENRRAAQTLHAKAVVTACEPLMREMSFEDNGFAKDIACWSMWEEHRFPHDAVPQLPEDVVQRMGMLGLLES